MRWKKIASKANKPRMAMVFRSKKAPGEFFTQSYPGKACRLDMLALFRQIAPGQGDPAGVPRSNPPP
jgi:hypothetical protein